MNENDAKSKKGAVHFKLDRNITEISDKALSVKALKIYLLLCRRTNRTKNQGCCFSGANDANKYTGLLRDIYPKAIEELIKKHLIVQREDIGRGKFNSIPVEVLAFPLYNAQSRQFGVDNQAEDQHRRYPKGKFINIPNSIVDNAYLKIIKTTTDLLTLLKLYNRTSIKDFHGVDLRYIHCFNSKNPNGYVQCKNEQYSKVVKMDKFEKFNNKIDCSAVNNLLGYGLIECVPVLIYQDPLDPDNVSIIKELIRDCYDENTTLYTPKTEGYKVIEILKPVFTKDEAFTDIQNED